MRLLFICHLYCPIHNAGGETTIHAANRALVSRGHEVHVICKPHSTEQLFEPYKHEGVNVVCPPRNAEPSQWFKQYAEKYQPDIIATHLDLTFLAEQLALDTKLPLAHFVHNDIGQARPGQAAIGFHRVMSHRCQLAVYNSEWVARNFAYKKAPQVVVHPVIEPERYRCERGDKITFINPTPDKGADTFYQLSKALPHRQFLVVKSVYGEQIAPPNINGANFPNVEVMEHTADIREAFRQSRVVLMPSIYESYGRVAVEAACARIPSIVHPTEGLLEALGADHPEWVVQFAQYSLDRHRQFRKFETPKELKGGWVSGAGIFCDRNDIESWATQIERLFTDDIYYRSRSDAAVKLTKTLDPQGEYDRLEMALLNTIDLWKKEEVKTVAMWTPDVRLWETTDGKLVREIAGRIPQDASRLWGLGPIPEEVAIANGLIPSKEESKAIEAPAENKAIEAPQEVKAKKTRKKKAA